MGAFIFIFVLVATGCLWWGAIAAMRARSRREQAGLVRLGAMCGQCRYPRDGLADNAACPECGTEPASTPPLATRPPRASGRLAWVPFVAMIACAASAMAVGNFRYLVFALLGAAGVLLCACVVALVMGLRRKATTIVLFGHLMASACVAIALTVLVSLDHNGSHSATGLEILAVPSMWVMGLLAVPLLTYVWEGVVAMWSLRRRKA